MDSSVLREVEQLRDAPIEHLRMKYRAVFQEEPRSKHKQQLFRRIAWRLQALAEGDLSERARRRASELAQDANLRVLAPRAQLDSAGFGRSKGRHDRRIPIPGTQLSRAYDGQDVLVRVLAEGFEYQGRRYRSLSAIAHEVTGTRWNGLAFFGLVSKGKSIRRCSDAT